LKIAAKYADAVNWFGDPEIIAHKLDVLRAHCDAVSRDAAEIEITRLGTLYITDSDAETQRFRSIIASNAGEQAARVALVGGESEVLDRIGALAAAGVQTFLVNMPLSDPDQVVRAGTLLSKSL
jgi:alkanesulfonate monooxygenase SsuD/methylene tetrahydromethanopterin reductase-like flavin-dependent oxidoreductase (luciferase family)